MRRLLAHSLLPALVASLAAQNFQLTTQTLASTVGAGKVAIGDLNADGFPDIVNVGLGQSVQLNGGSGGNFAAPVLVQPTLFGNWLQLADATDDGQLDLLTCDMVGLRIWLMTPAGLTSTYALGQARCAGCGDFDEDGKVDLLIGRDVGLSFARSLGGGNYAPETVHGGSGFGYIQVLVGDLNGDGHLDAIANSLLLPLQVRLGNGHGNFFEAPDVPLPSGYSRTALTDFDADGLVDILITSGSNNLPVYVRRGLGNGTFAAATQLTGINGAEAVIADFDGDGHADIVTAATDRLVVALGSGGGQFSPTTSFSLTFGRGLAASDLDGDGRLEAVIFDDSTMLRVLRDVSPVPIGSSAIGVGTPACDGTVGIRATVSPAVGSSTFRVQCTNVPPRSVGSLMLGIGTQQSLDPYGIGLNLHLVFGVILDSMTSDLAGTASSAQPIPNAPWAVGMTLHMQSLWLADPRLGNTCSPALYDLVSSRCLELTFQ